MFLISLKAGSPDEVAEATNESSRDLASVHWPHTVRCRRHHSSRQLNDRGGLMCKIIDFSAAMTVPHL